MLDAWCRCLLLSATIVLPFKAIEISRFAAEHERWPHPAPGTCTKHPTSA